MTLTECKNQYARSVNELNGRPVNPKSWADLVSIINESRSFNGMALSLQYHLDKAAELYMTTNRDEAVGEERAAAERWEEKAILS